MRRPLPGQMDGSKSYAKVSCNEHHCRFQLAGECGDHLRLTGIPEACPVHDIFGRRCGDKGVCVPRTHISTPSGSLPGKRPAVTAECPVKRRACGSKDRDDGNRHGERGSRRLSFVERYFAKRYVEPGAPCIKRKNFGRADEDRTTNPSDGRFERSLQGYLRADPVMIPHRDDDHRSGCAAPSCRRKASTSLPC
jgi:hypothetical protein